MAIKVYLFEKTLAGGGFCDPIVFGIDAVVAVVGTRFYILFYGDPDLD